MAASSASIGYGGTVTFDAVAVEEVLSVSVPSLKMDPVEATHAASDNTYKEFLAGLRDGGEVSIEVNARPKATGQTIAITKFHSGATCAVVITLPNSLGIWTETCFFTGYSSRVAAPDKMVATITLKVTGKPVLS